MTYISIEERNMANRKEPAMIPNYLTSRCERDICRNADCAEAVKQRPDTGRWYITMGHPGFNSSANNRDGYRSAANARAAVRMYGARGARIENKVVEWPTR
jgi:hypothetical protein